MINVSEWKKFNVGKLLKPKTTKLSIKSELDKGNIPFISRTGLNNGVDDYVDVESYKVTHGDCITIGAEGLFAFYQANDFATGNKVYALRNPDMNKRSALFICTILNLEVFKYSYGRARVLNKLQEEIIKLPAKLDGNNNFVIDENKKYSDEGYIPDWDYMEKFIERLETRERESQGSIRDEIRTKNDSKDTPKLNVNTWEEFILKDLFKVQYGVNLELNKCLEISNGINFVSRTSENNGISSQVEEIDGLSPQSPGLITVAGGGSVLSTFLQNEPFYSGRDLYTLECKKDISNEAKLFIITVIEQNKYKYNYGRQANRTLPDLILKLPIERNAKNKPVIDENKIFSPKGYIPDWDFMENYIKSLPYGEKI